MAKDPCPKSEDGVHELFPRDGKAPVLYEDPLLGWGADVRCVLCLKHGFVRLDFDNPRWEEEEPSRSIPEPPLQNLPHGQTGWEACSPGCRGWLHFDEPFEIEKCDECKRFGSDGDAVEAHRVECGCAWPEMDYQDAIMSWMDELRRGRHKSSVGDAIPEIALLDKALSESSSGDFYRELQALITLTTEAIDKTPMDSLERESLSHVRDLMKKARAEIESGKLTFAHFNDNSFWAECAKCGKGMSVDDAVRTEGVVYHPACSPENQHVTH